ncbi:MAG: putative terminase small subunit [Prokaryotic dsDNA virus sp.]|jgi:phage terminase small subunit|nr:MAG: putative terminase small subunit [Prokaryotic dsDNA virus sp.]|tara:strand:- start:7673 stop:8095 length:423 start_codon:yes stop_codon:yes gene_type:complete
MKLTQKQENFALNYVECGNASEAYRRSYNASNMKTESVNRKAHDVLENVNVSARVEELKQQHRERHNVTVDDLLNELEEARTVALTCETPQSSAAVSATMGKAKILGLDKQVIDHVSSDGTMTPKGTVIASDVQDILDNL